MHEALNCVINFYFHIYLMLYACVERFEVIENLENLLIFGELNKAVVLVPSYYVL